MSIFILLLLALCAVFYTGTVLYRIIYDLEHIEFVEYMIAILCIVFIVGVWIL